MLQGLVTILEQTTVFNDLITAFFAVVGIILVPVATFWGFKKLWRFIASAIRRA